MAQPSQDRPPLRAVPGDQRGSGTGSGGGSEPPDLNEASVQQIWDLVRKSTDVIVALREENAMLRSELSALRKSEQVLQDRLQDFLERIDTLERQARHDTIRGKDESTEKIDRLEDSLTVPQAMADPDERNVTITINIKEQNPRRTDDGINDTLQQIVEAATSALRKRA